MTPAQAPPRSVSALTVGPRLRAETAALHEAVEGKMRLGAEGLTREAYRTELERLWGFFAPLEDALAVHGPAFARLNIDLEERRRQGLLAEDLEGLGSVSARLPRTSALPLLASPLEALGALYVLEGATLGGQVLSRRIGPSLGLDAEHGLRFLSSGGAPVGPRWQAFQRALTAATPTDEAATAVVSGARTTFQSLLSWLDATGAT